MSTLRGGSKSNHKKITPRAADNSMTVMDADGGLNWSYGCSLFNCCLCIPPVYGVLLLSLVAILNAVTQTFFHYSFSAETDLVSTANGFFALFGVCFCKYFPVFLKKGGWCTN